MRRDTAGMSAGIRNKFVLRYLCVTQPRNSILRDFPSTRAGRDIGDAMVAIIEAHRDIFPTCLNCKHFNEPYSWCALYHANPPARTIVNACPAYDDIEEIPF